MSWIKSNGRWTALNLFALLVLGFVLSRGSANWNDVATFDPGLESGKWSIRFLLACLAMTPLRTYFGWSYALKLRKSTGLWSFGFAVVHVIFFLREAQLSWLDYPMQSYLALGLTGLLILSALAMTSNRWAMRRLRKNWKRLHRMVYLASVSVIVHAILAASASKKMYLYDPDAVQELKIYLAVLAVLLVVRIPLVRRSLQRVRPMPRPQASPKVPLTIITLPNGTPEHLDTVIGHGSVLHFEDLPLEAEYEGEAESLELVPD